MGLRPDDFYAMTPTEFIYAWIGWASREVETERRAWERERWSTWVLVSIQLSEKDRQPMTQMLPLPWDEAEANAVQKMDVEGHRARANKIMNELNTYG